MNIEGIKRMARELNIDMLGNGIHCLPRDVRKYTGTIHRVNRRDGVVVWVVKVRNRWFYSNATFYNEAEAFEHLKKVNVKEGLNIKNKLTFFESKVVVSLPNGSFTCDVSDLDVVEKHLWSSNRKGYVTAKVNGKTRSFHNVITNNNSPLHINTEFINKNPLNCCKSNLCLVDKRVINITRHMQQNNTLGTVGVHYD